MEISARLMGLGRKMLRVLDSRSRVVFLAGVASAERRVALVMGDDDYRTVRKLDNAINDARTLEETLKKLGFDVFLEPDRDLRRMRRALDDFREDAKGADVALVFFAGHGVEIGGENRLLPVDADASSLKALKASSLPLEEVRATVSAVSRVGLIILDACRNDPFGASDGSGRGVVALARDKDVKPGLGRIGRAENTLFAFSAAPGETASDGADGHSPFTTALAKYLGTDGLEIRSVLTLVQQEVYDLSRGKQLPYVESGLPNLFFASTSSAAIARTRTPVARHGRRHAGHSRRGGADRQRCRHAACTALRRADRLGCRQSSAKPSVWRSCIRRPTRSSRCARN